MAENLDTLARRIRAIERRMQLATASRRLEQSAVGGGGLRVHDEGSISIEEGGSLEITSGNLVLGEGMIDGSALAHQLTVDHEAGSRTGFPVAGSWQDVVTLEHEPPEWADRTIVLARAVGIANNPDADWFPQRILSRFSIGGQESPETAGTGFIYRLQRTAASVSFAWSAIVDATAGEPLTVAFQVRGDGGGTIETTDNRVGVSATLINVS